MFKNTKAFEIMTILEQMLIKNKIKNTIKFMIVISKYEFITKNFKIKKKSLPEEKMNLLKELFKEYFYLYTIIDSKNIDYEKKSIMTHTIFNGKIDAIITYSKSNNRIYISYDLASDYFTLFVICDKNTKGINIDDHNLKIKDIDDIAYTLLNMIFNDISYMMTTMFITYNKLLS